MKFAVALLISAVVAVKLRDEERTSFLQVSACNQYAVDGATCLPNQELFASTMNGDDAGEQPILDHEITHTYPE